MKNTMFRSFAALGLSSCMMGAAVAQSPQTSSTVLTMNPTMLSFDNSRKTGTMYMPDSVTLSDQKPSCIKKEPHYEGVVQYGVIDLGNGPRRAHAFAIDTFAQGRTKIYVDLLGNGDLTQSGSGDWQGKEGSDSTADYRATFVFRVSYGTREKETSSGQYGLNLYWNPNRASLNFYRASELKGAISINGQKYAVSLYENNNNGLYNQPYVVSGKQTKPVFLFLDGAYVDARGTFPLDGYNYQAVISADGCHVTLKPTYLAITAPPVTSKEPELLTVGKEAPDFEVPSYGGGTVRLSDLRGKIVVLDFWATWCGPCKASLPHLEKVYNEIKDKNVAVVALNTWDDKKAYDQWIPDNKQYTFPFAFDPGGRGASSIAAGKYNVSGIPTTYVIAPNGKIAAAIVGYEGLNDHRIEQALNKLNVAINVEQPKTMPMIGLGGK